MANLFSHTQTRCRRSDYACLDQKLLKEQVNMPVGTKFSLRWNMGKRNYHSVLAQRIKNGLFIFTEKDRGYRIRFTQTQLSYGKRTWYQCPACGRRCALLYHAGNFACRHCVKPAYDCQNGSQTDYLLNKIIDARQDLWGKDNPLIKDLMESCRWFDKPKHLHWKTFERKRDKIIKLEEKRNRLLIAQVDSFLMIYKTLLD